jgi:hypothetical protein
MPQLPHSRARRPRAFAFLAATLGVAALDPAVAQAPSPMFANPVERRMALHEMLLDTVRIETQLQGWTLRKVCLDGQAYWIGFSETAPTGISVAYKDGKPEQCARRAR